MNIREAKRSDLPACGAIDHGYTTDCSWQISEERSVRTGSAEITIVLRPVNLPRQRSVAVKDLGQALDAEWETNDLLLVAEEEALVGYLAAHAEGKRAVISRLAVDRPFRRTGVGSKLLSAALTWARDNDLRHILVAVPIKNHPAVTFFRSRGYVLCGYNERHDAVSGVVLYMALNVAFD